jgi:hypothetical protein
MSKLAKALTAAAGNAGGGALYAEDVFSTYLYTGTGVAITIDNGIDLAGEGGLVWLKNRGTVSNHSLHDTERTPSYQLSSNSTAAEDTLYGDLTSFNSDGFSLGTTGGGNNITGDIASWTFRKAEKFFDVVTYTGTGSVQTISHNLGVAPAVVIVKAIAGTNAGIEFWAVYHASLGATKFIRLNTTDAAVTSNSLWNDTAPTDTHFTVNNNGAVNNTGLTYVAYLFASDAGGFGDDGLQNVISCGSVTLDGAGQGNVNLGYEPQWVMYKRTDGAGNWIISDSMRGWTALPNQGAASLLANSAAVEGAYSPASYPNSTGFLISGSAGQSFIYIAIRRPMKTPESGTEVFMPALASSSGDYTAVAGFPVDMNIYSQRSSANNHFTYDRLRGGSYLATDDTAAETGDFADWDSMTDFYVGGVSGDYSDYINWMFKRATGFFDVVAWTGNNNTNQRVSHNLSVVPELIIYKGRNKVNYWMCIFWKH